MKPFAIYRLPGEHFATRISASKIAVPTDCCDLNSRSGFVIAPFIPSSQSPLLLIEPEDVRVFVPDEDNGEPLCLSLIHI